jgi:LysM repeat protein
MAAQLQKAFIYDEDHKRKALECLFNPTEYSFRKGNSWDVKSLPGQNVPSANFTGGDVMTMSFQLFFDTYSGASEDADQDVRDYTEKLLTLMKIDTSLNNGNNTVAGRPPIVSFHWGNYWSFKGVITNVELRFTLFTGQGKPVRATANVTLQQFEELGTYPRQNPTSGGEGVRASHVVQPGDTLDLIAYQEYGDATQWRPIARANHLENPRAIRPGQRLVVPELV